MLIKKLLILLISLTGVLHATKSYRNVYVDTNQNFFVSVGRKVYINKHDLEEIGEMYYNHSKEYLYTLYKMPEEFEDKKLLFKMSKQLEELQTIIEFFDDLYNISIHWSSLVSYNYKKRVVDSAAAFFYSEFLYKNSFISEVLLFVNPLSIFINNETELLNLLKTYIKAASSNEDMSPLTNVDIIDTIIKDYNIFLNKNLNFDRAWSIMFNDILNLDYNQDNKHCQVFMVIYYCKNLLNHIKMNTNSMIYMLRHWITKQKKVKRTEETLCAFINSIELLVKFANKLKTRGSETLVNLKYPMIHLRNRYPEFLEIYRARFTLVKTMQLNGYFKLTEADREVYQEAEEKNLY